MNMIDAEFITHLYKILPVLLSLLGAFSSFMFYAFFSKSLFQFKISFIGRKIYNFLNKKWFFDKVYNEYLSQFLFKFGYNVSYKIIDRGIFEIFGPMGLSSSISKLSYRFAGLQTGYLYHITLFILIGSSVLLGIRQFWLVFGYLVDFRLIIIILLLTFFIKK